MSLRLNELFFGLCICFETMNLHIKKKNLVYATISKRVEIINYALLQHSKLQIMAPSSYCMAEISR